MHKDFISSVSIFEKLDDTVLEKISSPLISLDLDYNEQTYFGYINFET